MGQREARLHEQIPGLVEGQLQRNGKGEGGGLARPIELVRADLREELPVDVGLLVALRVRHSPLVDLSQQRLGKALVHLPERLVQRARFAAGRRLRRGANRLCARLDGLFRKRLFAQRLLAPEQLHAVHPLQAAVGMLVRIAVVDVLGDVREELAADLIGLSVKDDEVDGHVAFHQKRADRVDGDSERLILRKTIDAGGDQRKGDRLAVVFPGQEERRPIAGGEHFRLPLAAAPPYGPHGMDHILAGQPVALRDPGAPGLAAAQCPAFLQQLGAGGAMDTAVDAAAAQKRRIGRVDDGVHVHFRDVIPDDLKGHRATRLSSAPTGGGASSREARSTESPGPSLSGPPLRGMPPDGLLF